MEETFSNLTNPETVQKRSQFSGLAIPDNLDHAKSLLERSPKNENEAAEEEVDDMMAALEGMQGRKEEDRAPTPPDSPPRPEF